jgi:hypothetical protein
MKVAVKNQFVNSRKERKVMENKPSFYRAEALNEYKQAQGKIVSPRLTAPCNFLFLWLGLAVLLILSGLVVMQLPLFF